MDEAEKYQRRLEAIAEKRRLQDEQEKVRREMEEERLRLQQLKRKSLRDQWLMEGAPLSPTSLDAQNPRSPLWGSQAQEMEKHIDKLQAESQRLEDEREREQLEDGQEQEAVKVADTGAEMVQGVVVQNGETKTTALETTDVEVKLSKSPRVDGETVVLTNGGGAFKDDHHQSNGPFSVVSMKAEPGLSPGVSEAEPGHVSKVDLNEDNEEGTLVMRAECVIITDVADEDVTPKADEQESVQETPHQGVRNEEEENMEEVMKTEPAPELIRAPESTSEVQPDTGAGQSEVDIINQETKGEAQETSVQLQPPPTAVASVPVYSETQSCTVAPVAEVEAVISPGEGAQDPVTVCEQFQEVPLADPQENQRTDAALAEQEPLLGQAKAPSVGAAAAAAVAAAAAADSPVNTDTHGPTRASQHEAPKRKTCQCCSVM